ncbi:hypothetical protein [Hymenobacter sp. PAMC 26628]|uniref:hypothetical protein n=1 Tax=Hymenobacter sp. PAMC 26628 TaxID=1484118 RepID=UPI0012FF9D8E|nr:hypothetical protein [Hymenobacter sp. PAMC 26628]
MLLVACNEPARQPTTEVPAASPGGVPGTPSGPRPSDEALNAPAQTESASLNPTAAAAAADSVAKPAAKNVPFVSPLGVKHALGNRPAPGSSL